MKMNKDAKAKMNKDVKAKIQSFENDEAGKLDTDTVLGLVVGIIAVAVAIPIAIGRLSGANTTGWSTDVIAIWDMLPIFAVLAVLVMIAAYVKGKK